MNCLLMARLKINPILYHAKSLSAPYKNESVVTHAIEELGSTAILLGNRRFVPKPELSWANELWVGNI